MATCGPKKRALAMVTARNFGREVALRVVPSSCNDGFKWTSFELLVKKSGLPFTCVEGKFAVPAPFCHVRYGFLYGCFSDFFIGMAAEERNIVGKHGHLYAFRYDSPKVVYVQQEEERRQGAPFRESLA